MGKKEARQHIQFQCDYLQRLKTTIIIPTFNGGKFVDTLLAEIFNQTYQPDELLIVDSESTDGTVNIVKKYINNKYPIKFIQISRGEFGHGKTRNYAASIANSDILVFLTQDAIPAHNKWLENLLKPFTLHKDVACVFGRHIPREDCNPLIKRDILNHFESFGEEAYVYQKIDWKDSSSVKYYYQNKGWYCFNSNVNSAVRKDVWEKIKFRDVLYAEDQLFGKDIIEAGYTKVYARDATVIHSHNYTLLKFLKRYFDEYRGLKITLGYVDSANLLNILPATIKASFTDIQYILKNTTGRKLYWCIYAPLFHLIRRLGAYLGGRYEHLPPFIQKLLSLEKRIITTNV